MYNYNEKVTKNIRIKMERERKNSNNKNNIIKSIIIDN